MGVTFSGWQQTAMRELFARFRQERAKMRAKTQETQRRMVSMLMGSQAGLLEKGTFSGWHEAVTASKHEKFLFEMKRKGAESNKRMLAMLMGSQAETLKKVVFTGWHEHIMEIKQERNVDKLQQQMRDKKTESSKRMLGMLLGAQAEVLLKAAFAGWVGVMTEVRFERIRENNLKMKGKEQERQKRMLSMLLGSQASLVVKSTFSAWQEMLYNLKKERELERIKFAMNSKNDAHTKKMLGLLMGS